MIKQHKDKIFILAMLVTLGNLVYWNFYRIWAMSNGAISWENVGFTVMGIVAVAAILYLLRQNRLRNKIKK